MRLYILVELRECMKLSISSVVVLFPVYTVKFVLYLKFVYINIGVTAVLSLLKIKDIFYG